MKGKKLIWTLLLLSLSIPNLLSAQSNPTFSGYVKDAETGETLIGVNILIYPEIDGVVDSTTYQGAVSNVYGYYSISLPKGNYRVSYSYIGYLAQSETIQLMENLTLDVEVRPNAENLVEVVVAAEQSRARSADISVNKIDPKTIERLPTILGEPDVLRSIQLLPGVSSANEASSGFNVRGGSADQNLILLDEGIIYNASHLFGLFSVFNTDAIRDIKLYKGGIPSQYGGRLSSVLDIQQREGNRKNFGGKATIGLISSKVLLEGPLLKDENQNGKGSFMIAGRRSYADLFTFLNSEFDGNKLFFYDLNLKANIDLNEKNKLFASGYFGRDRFELPGLVGTFWGNASGTLRWTSILNQKLFFQTSAVVSNYDYNLDVLRTGSELRWNASITNFNLKPKVTWFANPNYTLRFGADGLTYDFKPGQISPLENSPVQSQTFDQQRAFEGGVYADAEQNIGNKLQLRYGLRWSAFWRLGSANVNIYEDDEPLEYNADFENYLVNDVVGVEVFSNNEVVKAFQGLEPRLAVNYRLSQNSSVKLGYNRMFQYVHLISNTSSPTPLDIWTPSGEYLEPQRADQLSVGYFKEFSEKGYRLNVESFYKDINNKTEFVDGADLLFTEDIETEVVQGEARAYGLEVLFEKTKGKLRGWVSYTLSRSESKVLGINSGMYFPSNFDQLHELNITGTYTTDTRWDFGFSWIYGSGRPITYPSGKYEYNGLVVADYSTRNQNRLPDYHRLDLSATLKPKDTAKRNGTWVFSIANVYNRQNAASIFFREVSEVNGVESATGNTEAVKLAYFGIVPSVSYSFTF